MQSSLRLSLIAALAAACGDNTSAAIDANLLPGGDSGAGGSDGGIDGATGSDGGVQPGTVRWTLVDAPHGPAAFSFVAAYQDGDGAWQVAPAPASGTDVITLPITADHYAVAYTCVAADNSRSVDFGYFLVSEQPALTTIVPERCTDRTTRVTLSGTIANAPRLGLLHVLVGDRDVTAPVGATTGSAAYTTTVLPGTYDVVVLHEAPGIGPGTGSDVIPDQIAIHRGVTVSATATVAVDFGSAAAPVFVTDTVGSGGGSGNGSGARVLALTELFAAGTAGVLTRDTARPFTSAALATAQRAASDEYAQSIEVTAAGSLGVNTDFVAAPTALTFAPPPVLGTATATVGATTPYPRVTLAWPAYATAIGYVWRATQGLAPQQCGTAGRCTVTWTALISPGAATASPMFAVPDLSGLAGWSAKLQPVTGTPITGSLTALRSSAGAADFVRTSVPPVGTRRSSSSVAWTVTP